MTRAPWDAKLNRTSLTSQLEAPASPLRRFFESRLPNRAAIVREVREAASKRLTIRPSEPVPWGTVGEAIDYRIVFSFPAARPLAGEWGTFAIEGMVIVDLDQPIPHLPAERGALTLVATRRFPRELVRDFFLSLRERLQALLPCQPELDPSAGEELCRHCYVLGLFDEITRAGPAIRSPLYEIRPGGGVEDLLGIASPASIDDLCRMPAAFFETQRELLAAQAILKPTFLGSRDVGGADADVIADGCLIEIKTAVDPGNVKKRTWPWQLLGYALLDYDDEYQIDSVGLYLARQALLLRWPLAEFASKLAERPMSIDELRRGLQRLV